MGHLNRFHDRMVSTGAPRLLWQFPTSQHRRRLTARLRNIRRPDFFTEFVSDARVGLARAICLGRNPAHHRFLLASERGRDPSFETSRQATTNELVVSGAPLGALAFGFTIFWTVAYYTLLAWMPSFTQRFAGLAPLEALWSNTIGLIAMIVTIPIWGALSDKVGRRSILMASALSIGVLSWPLFSLMTKGGGLASVPPIQILFGILLV
jgi:Major Facilitator Superfamily